ncbi:MAG: radical SAM protein [Candidatus Micrarchaeota archaeon]|nr:radical SAM protein [Candidatus Micrarchaeota archaeon]
MGNTKKFVGLGLTALRSNVSRLDKPYKLNFATTYWCQSRCLTCNIWQMKPKNELRIDEINEFAKKNDHFRWIGITGGEPFMRSDVVDIADAFMKSSKDLYLVTIPTNSLSDQKMVISKIEKMLQLGIPKLSITLSLDGSRELHDRIRGVPGNFDRVMGVARTLREMQRQYSNLFFIFGYTMSRYNHGALGHTCRSVMHEVPGTKYSDFHINLSHNSSIYYNNIGMEIAADRMINSAELEGFLNKREREMSVIQLIETVFLKNLINYANTGKPPVKSRSLDASLFMDSFGNVYPSIQWDRKIGNIRDTAYDLAPIWNGTQAEQARRIISEGNDPGSWTACEAYQSIVGHLPSFASLLS